jgi:hypothetical protein
MSIVTVDSIDLNTHLLATNTVDTASLSAMLAPAAAAG